MLRLIKKPIGPLRSVVALLFFISISTIHTLVSADIKEQTAEEYRALGYDEQQKGNLNEALAYYTKAASLGVESAPMYNDIGVLYEAIDLYSRAKHFYLLALETDAQYLPPYLNLAYLYQRLGKKDKAAAYFKQRYEMGNPEDPWAQRAKDELIKINPQYSHWAATIEAEMLNKKLEKKAQQEFYERVKRTQEHFQKGEEFFQRGKYEEAMQEYNMALRLSPNTPKIINARKKVILERAKEKIRVKSQQAIQRLEMGDTVSARHEIQNILTTIPKEPILLSR